MNVIGRPAAPRSFWIVSVFSLLWNAFGAFGYTMTNLRDPGYLAQFPPGMMDVIDAFPVWAMAAWALGVWGAIAGSLLLLMRSRFAVHAFAVSLAGLAASTVYQMSLSGEGAMPLGVINLLIWAGALFLLWYAVRQRKAGVLA